MKSFFLLEPRLLLFGFFISYFASYGQTFFISIFNLEIRSLLQLSDGQFGLIYSLATLTSAFILIWFGKLIDKIDLRVYTFIISIGITVGIFIGGEIKKFGKPITKIKKIKCRQKEK